MQVPLANHNKQHQPDRLLRLVGVSSWLIINPKPTWGLDERHLLCLQRQLLPIRLTVIIAFDFAIFCEFCSSPSYTSFSPYLCGEKIPIVFLVVCIDKALL